MLPGAPNPIIYPLKGGAPIRGREPESLDLATDLSWVPARETKVNLTIAGLADSAEDRVSFTVPFELVAPPRQADETAAPSEPGLAFPVRPTLYLSTRLFRLRVLPDPLPRESRLPSTRPDPVRDDRAGGADRTALVESHQERRLQCLYAGAFRRLNEGETWGVLYHMARRDGRGARGGQVNTVDADQLGSRVFRGPITMKPRGQKRGLRVHFDRTS